MQHAFITLVPNSNQQSVSIEDVKHLLITIKPSLPGLAIKLIMLIQIQLFLMKYWIHQRQR